MNLTILHATPWSIDSGFLPQRAILYFDKNAALPFVVAIQMGSDGMTVHELKYSANHPDLSLELQQSFGDFGNAYDAFVCAKEMHIGGSDSTRG